MPKKNKFSFKLSQRPGRFKIFERQGGEKLHIANVIVKTGLTESQAIRLIDLLNAKDDDKQISIAAHEQKFIQRVRNAVADLWADDGENYDVQYRRGIFELGAMLTQRWDDWTGGTDRAREEIQNWLLGRETIESTPKFPHPVLADVSEYLLKAEDRLNDLRDYDLDEDKFGVLDIETDVQTLVAKVQGILDAEEAHAESKQE